jgi:hypothetical protein
MSMISPCIEPGCSKLCMGLFCIDHDSGPRADFPRGRPWPPAKRGAQPVAAVALPALVPDAGRAPVRPAA